MKTYEEMAQNVLKRRDEQIKINSLRRRRTLKIAVPCAAAFAVAAAGAGVWIKYNPPSGHFVNRVTDTADPGAGKIMTGGVTAANSNADHADPTAEIAQEAGTFGDGSFIDADGNYYQDGIDIAIADNIDPADISNPRIGENDIRVLEIEDFGALTEEPDLTNADFNPYTIDELNRFYGIYFNRLSYAHPDWDESSEDLGIYTEDGEEDGIVAWHANAWTRNTLNYTADSGAKITVMAQQLKFPPISDEEFAKDKPSAFESEIEYIYDDDGNEIGATAPAYDPTQNDEAPENDEGVSLVNGYDALIYRDSSGNFAADLIMNSRVRIYAEGLSEEEFLAILDEYTR